MRLRREDRTARKRPRIGPVAPIVILIDMSAFAVVGAGSRDAVACPTPTGNTSPGGAPLLCGGGCTPVTVTVTAYIYEGKAEVDLGGIYLANGHGAQYAAGCGENHGASVYEPTSGYSFWMWQASGGSFNNLEANPAYYTPPTSNAAISLILSVDNAVASTDDWGLGSNTVYEGGYQVVGPNTDTSGSYCGGCIWTDGKIKNPLYATWLSWPCDPNYQVCDNHIEFAIGIGTPDHMAVAGVRIDVSYTTSPVTVYAFADTPTNSLQKLAFGSLGDTYSVEVECFASSGTTDFSICDPNPASGGGGCWTPTSTGDPIDTSRAFFGTSALTDGASWYQEPYLNQTVSFYGLSPSPPYNFLPADRVWENFDLGGYTPVVVRPSYLSFSSGTGNAFTLSFCYGDNC